VVNSSTPILVKCSAPFDSLLGTWALDCGQPPSGSNGHLSYVVRTPGKVSHERNFGDKQDVNEVQKATTGRGGWLQLVVNFPGISQSRKFTLMMAADGRIKALSNSKADGTEPTIKNGKFTAKRQRHALASALPLNG
jgi:hypothetical protein